MKMKSFLYPISAIQETFYKHVIGDVCKSMREAFMNEGVDEQVLTELKEASIASS